MLRTLLLGAAALCLAGAAQAAPAVGSGVPIVIADQEQVTVGRVGAGWGVLSTGRVTIQPEVGPAPRNTTQEYMTPVGRPPSFTAAPSTVRFSLWTNPREGARLKMENNTGRPLIYSAEIVIAGNPRPQPTSICSVQSGRAGYELWPDNVTAIRITGFYPAPADRQVCGNPERGQTGAPPPSLSSGPVPQGPAPQRSDK